MTRHFTVVAVLISVLFSGGTRAQQDWLYSVRPGDNIWDLCLKYTSKANCWLELGDYNELESSRWLPPGLILRFPISWLKSIPTPVTVSYFSGDVRYQTSPEQSDTLVQEGAKLPIGSKLTTGPESIAGLTFGDGSVMQVEPNSTVVLDALSVPGDSGFVDSRIRLQSGAVKTRVPERQPKSRFQITTPAAIAAVRGTEFRVAAYADEGEKAAMTGEVFEGEVGVAGTAPSSADKDAAKAVKAGFGIKAKQGEALADPKPLPATPQWGEVAALQKPPIIAVWTSVEDAVAYRLEISRSDQEGNAGPLLLVTTTDKLQYSDSDQSFVNGCYGLAVRAIDAEGLMGLANQTQVCTRDKLATPMIKTRALSFSKKDTEVELDWQSVADASRYRLEISTSPNFETAVTRYDITGTTHELTLSEDLQDGFYYRVQAQGDDLVSSDSSSAREVRRQDEPLAALLGWSVFWVLLIAL